MKNFIVIFFLIAPELFFSQILTCKNGLVKFVSDAPMELIKAQSNKVTSVVNLSTKNFAFSVPIESFQGFNSALQREHFNENYLESVKYATGEFIGKIIEDFDLTKDGIYTIRAKGIFKIHGISKEQIVKVRLRVKNKEAEVDSTFEILLSDYNINIPKVVNQKIASVVQVEIKAALKPHF